MHGLTVRWSLTDAAPDVAQQLREYVCGTSLARFTGMEGLAFKTWRMREGEWFEGTYVWATAAARDAFAEQFAATGADNPGSQLVGSAPALIEPFEVVAVAEGGAGFAAGPGPASA
ncbi:MAG: hypothetical protein ACTHN8_12040 [Angustibacter sp.]